MGCPYSLPPKRPNDLQNTWLQDQDLLMLSGIVPIFHKQKIEISQWDDVWRYYKDSMNALSSHFLLAKKTYGSWRFCIDCRALDQITTNDRFPIPTVDEVIDEWDRSSFYLNLDVKAGYQIDQDGWKRYS